MAVNTGFMPDSFICDGQQTPRTIPWPFVSPADIIVSINGQPVSGGWRVQGIFPAAQFIPLFGFAPAGARITIGRRTPAKQDYRITGALLDRAALEGVLDRQTMVGQELSARQDGLEARAVIAAPGENGLLLPALADRRNQLLGFDASGERFKAFPVGASGGVDVLGALGDPDGAALVGLDGRSVLDKLREVVSVTDGRFAGGARGDGFHDDTTAFRQAILALRSAGGGVLMVPPGRYSVNPLVWLASAGTSIVLQGFGPHVSQIVARRSDAPLLTLDGSGALDVYGGIRDIGFVGLGRVGIGVKLKLAARFELHRVGCWFFDTNVDGEGSLLFELHSCILNECKTSFRVRKGVFQFNDGPGTIYPNMVLVSGGEARAFDHRGFDIDHAQGFKAERVNVETGGTFGDIQTGGFYFGADMDEETGFSSVALSGCHIERIGGRGVVAAGAGGLEYAERDMTYGGNDAGRDIDIGGIRSVSIHNINANQSNPGATIRIEAVRSYVHGRTNELVDTSIHQLHQVETKDAIHHQWSTSFRLRHAAYAPNLYDFQLMTDFAAVLGSDKNTAIVKYDGNVYFRFQSVQGRFPLALGPDKLGAYGNEPVAKPTVGGSRGGNVALQNLTAALARIGFITDLTTD